jgi:hypothetical protein
METPDKYEKLPIDVVELMQEAETLTQDVLKRVERSAKKYGAAYSLADISSELNEEVLDLVGWTLLEALRIRLILSKKLASIDGEYLEKFLKYHDKDYLQMLKTKIEEELNNRS